MGAAADAGQTPIDIDLGASPQFSPSGATVSPAEDGTTAEIYDFSPQTPAPLTDDPSDPDANLALQMDESDLDEIGAELLDKIDEDKRSAEPWYETLASGIDLLGVTFEERTFPFKGASGAYDPVLAEAVFRGYAKARGELMPAAGPVKTQIVGAETDDALDRSARVQAWMNLYLTTLAPEYYTDFDQMLFWWALAGSMFKKVYQDPIKGRPVAPFIMPQKFVVAYGTTSLDSCVRATHECTLSQREVKLRQIAGIWRDLDLGDPDAGSVGVAGMSSTGENPVTMAANQAEGMTSQNAVSSRSRYIGDAAWEIPESHVDLDLSSLSNRPDPLVPQGLPVPYRVTMARQSRKVLAIQRNWMTGDPMYGKRNWFIQYKLLPGTGFYGFGYAHLLCNSARTGTALTRQIIDGTTLGMFTGGVRAKGMKLENNNLMIGPCEFPEIDTGGQKIGDVFAPLPIREVSPVSLDTLKFTAQRAENLANTVDIAVGDGRQDAPVGTTVALQEAANIVTSVMIKNAHVSLRREFEAFHTLFGEHLPSKPYPFAVRPSKAFPNGQTVIMRADFQPGVQILPVSDPNITSSSQRMMRAQAINAAAATAPDLYNRRAVQKQFLISINLSDDTIEELLPQPQQGMPADPLTENQMALAGAPLQAAPWQDHAAHIQVHQMLAQMPSMQAHIAQHIAMQMRAQVEAIIGHSLPASIPGHPLPPEVENRIAALTAQAMQRLKQQKGNSITQDDIIQAEMAAEANKLAEKAQAAQTSAAAKTFAATLKYRSDQEDRGVRMRIAEINAAATAARSQTPPPDYIQQILDAGNREALGLTVLPLEAPIPTPPAPSGAVPPTTPGT